MKRHFSHRLLAVLTTLSVSTLALSAHTVVTTDTELRAAVTTNNADIQIGTDITIPMHITIANTVTIDLNGHTLSGDNMAIPGTTDYKCLFIVAPEGNLTLRNGTLAHTDNSGAERRNPKSGRAHSAGAIVNKGAATLEDITITDCKGIEGGAIRNTGTLNIQGEVNITGNTAYLAGGIYSNITMNMKDRVKITGNKDPQGFNSNLYLSGNSYIHLTGSLNGSAIGVDMDTPDRFTSGFEMYHGTEDPALYFSADRSEVMEITRYIGEGKLISSLPAGSVYFYECSWDETSKKVVYTLKVLNRQIGYTDTPEEGDYKLITTTSSSDWFALGGFSSDVPEYYVVKGNVNHNTLNVLGPKSHIILCDNSKLTLSGGILCYGSNHKLFIHSQSYSSAMGKLRAESGYSDEAAGIGSDYDHIAYQRPAGDIEIHGGDIYAKGGKEGAGIGGGYSQCPSKITIYNGKIEARGGDGSLSGYGGTGIGGGNNGSGGHITIYDGDIYAYGSDDAAGIGSGYYSWDTTSYVDIHGGYIEARGGANGAGIGGGSNSPGATLNIYDGTIYAYGGDDAAGIGGGWDGNGHRVTIHGGFVYAKGDGNGAGIGSGSESAWNGENRHGGWLTVTGGTVYAYGGIDAAGIGGGEDANGSTVLISGGYVHAEGKDGGAGIGGGEGSKGGIVTINGGTVIAKAGRNETGHRAIGGGEGCDEYGLLYLGDDVMVSSERRATAGERKGMCWYRTQVRVEPCDHSEVTYTVDGYTVADHHIAHCVYCNHTDTALHTFDEHGVCTVCGVQATAYAAKLYMPQAQSTGSFDGETYGMTATHLIVPESDFRLPMATLNVPGYTFTGWEATTAPSGESYISPYTTATADTLYRAGNKYEVTGDICFVARYKVSDIILYDDQPNSETLNEYNGMKVNKVILSGRVFNKNNTWQSIVLPFDLSADELAASPLAGCTLKELVTDSSYNDTENKLVYLYFKDTTAIAAGKPYIIRFTMDNSPIISPEFENVTLSNKTADAKAPLLLYKAIYSPQTFTSANKMVLYLNEDGVLVHPNGEVPVTVGAFRAYFRLTNLMGGDPDAEFTITSNLDGLQGVEEVQRDKVQSTKVIRNGMLFIERNGRIYDAQGNIVE